jgi:hypothetical protein
VAVLVRAPDDARLAVVDQQVVVGRCDVDPVGLDRRAVAGRLDRKRAVPGEHLGQPAVGPRARVHDHEDGRTEARRKIREHAPDGFDAAG